jgi:nucleoside-diphosphate-sugar epimerase
MGERVFLAGATGVVGRLLVPSLLAAGYHVTGITRRPDVATALRAQGADAVVVDVHDAAALADAVRVAAPDVVMHQLTDLSGGDRAANATVRVTGTRNLVDAALAAGVTRIVAQSIAFAYEGGDEPATEDTPLDLAADEARLATVLGVASLEESVREAPEWVVLRYGLFYGPGTWYSRGGLTTDTLVAGNDITSFLHVHDAATAAVRALAWPTGAVNVCDDEPAAGHEWVPEFCRSVGATAPARVDEPRQRWARGADNRYARTLGWVPRYPSWRSAGFDGHR